MTIEIRFFASLRERLGMHDTQLAAQGQLTVADVWRQATGTDAPPPNVLAAVNQEYAALDAPVRDGDEVAFFPPVTGG